MKTCSHCNETKDESAFFKRSGQPGKYLSMCRACRKAYDSKAWQEKMDDPELHELELARNKINRDNQKANGNTQRWIDANREHLNALKRASRIRVKQRKISAQVGGSVQQQTTKAKKGKIA